jgi:hypothetical protein
MAGSGFERRRLAAATGPRRSAPCWTLLPGRRRGLGRIWQSHLSLSHRFQDLVRDDILPPSRGEHQLEKNSLLQLFDGVDDSAAVVSANRPGSEDPPGWEHVHAKLDVANPSFPNSSSLLFLLLCSPHKHSWLLHGAQISATSEKGSNGARNRLAVTDERVACARS